MNVNPSSGGVGAPGVFAQKLNDLFQLPLFADDNLFDDREEDVSGRLQWPEESSTPEGKSYRKYAGESVRVLGARPYSLALYSSNRKVDQLSMVFANKGDYAGFADWVKDVGSSPQREGDDNQQSEERRKTIQAFAAAIRADGRTIADHLTSLLGPPDSTFFGVGSGMREKVLRWDWQGNSFLLATPRQEYVLLRMMSVERANHDGRAEKLSAAELKDVLAQRVERRENGDVVIRDIPMVDQGPKGYCVPATWERYLRYLGIPADMYVLAMTGSTSVGGGTSVDALEQSVAGLVSAYGRAIDNLDPSLDIKSVAKYIDKGIPLMWCCTLAPEHDKSLTARAAERTNVTDWGSYSEHLVGYRKQSFALSPENGHMRMIIGYNPKSKEIAISDSWGEQFSERWMTIEEAQHLSEDILIVIKW